MGQAKNKGSFEERKAQASTTGSALRSLVGTKEVPHYAFVLDKSAAGKKMLDLLKKGPSEIKQRFLSPSFVLWEQAHFPYVVVWGTFGYSGGLTVNALDLDTLCNEALPKVMERIELKGGLCSFIVNVGDDSTASIIQSKLAELQPTHGLPQ